MAWLADQPSNLTIPVPAGKARSHGEATLGYFVAATPLTRQNQKGGQKRTLKKRGTRVLPTGSFIVTSGSAAGASAVTRHRGSHEAPKPTHRGGRKTCLESVLRLETGIGPADVLIAEDSRDL